MTTFLRPAFAAITAAVVLGLSACGTPAAQSADEATSSPSANAPAAGGDTTAMIDVENIAFQPPEMTVLAGTKVTWINRDANVRHTATSGEGGDKGIPGVEEAEQSRPDGAFDGNLPNAGDTYSHVFTEAGTYDYFCAVHPSMRGTIVVE